MIWKCILHCPQMTTDKTNPKQLTSEEKREASIVIKRLFFEKIGLDPNLSEQRIRFGTTSKLSAEDELTLSMAQGLQIAMNLGMDQILSEIQTKEDLDCALRAVGEVAERGPTVAREVMDQVRTQLRRRGGPGRDPLLNDKKALLACDKISDFIREGCSEAEAIAKLSEASIELLGKKVGARTLKAKAWDRRAELTKMSKEGLK